jgi:hypothetical protein
MTAHHFSEHVGLQIWLLVVMDITIDLCSKPSQLSENSGDFGEQLLRAAL